MLSVIERSTTINNNTSQSSEAECNLTEPSAKQQERLHIRTLFSRYHESGSVPVRDELIRLHLGVVRYVAAKFTHRGESFEDLYQVGCIGLVKAVVRFDPSRGFEFMTFAIPTITGEICRYFRDLRWSIRVPRIIQARWGMYDKAVETLTRTHGRSPTIAEVAACMGVSEELVIEGQEARQAHMLSSIDAERDGHRATSGLGQLDPNLGAVDEELVVSTMLQALSERDRRLVEMRFTHQMSQRAIASELGVSQMQVSRLVARALATMRAAYVAANG